MRDTKTMYETIAWKDGENPQMPDDMRRFPNREAAKSYARAMAKDHGRVEVNRLEVNQEDENDLWECYLLASWENGRRIS